jgi:selenocysteine-specific elongation factor
LAGQRVALNLSGERLALEQIHRGHWLWPNGCLRRLNAGYRLQLLAASPAPLNTSSRCTCIIGTQDVTARVALLEGTAWRRAGGCSRNCCSTRRHAVKGRSLDYSRSERATDSGRRPRAGPVCPGRQRRSRREVGATASLGRQHNLRTGLPVLLAITATPGSIRSVWSASSIARARTGRCQQTFVDRHPPRPRAVQRRNAGRRLKANPARTTGALS